MNPSPAQSPLPFSPTGLYKLEGHIPVPCESSEEFFAWLARREVRLALDAIASSEIATEFSGVPCDPTGELFLTTIRGGPLHLTVTRGHTYSGMMFRLPVTRLNPAALGQAFTLEQSAKLNVVKGASRRSEVRLG